MTAREDVRVAATDGFLLAATVFRPAGAPRAVVLLNSAMAVKQTFYAKFAAWLAGEGFVAITWDYRGIGGSRAGKVDALVPLYANARAVTRRHVHPEELGRPIGHFDVFREAFRDSLWRDAAAFFEACAQHSRPG